MENGFSRKFSSIAAVKQLGAVNIWVLTMLLPWDGSPLLGTWVAYKLETLSVGSMWVGQIYGREGGKGKERVGN